MIRFLAHLRDAAVQALANDVFNTAKAVAYSGMLLLFPALLVVTTLLAQVPQGSTLVGAIRNAFEQVLPADSMDLLQSYVLNQSFHTARVIVSAGMLFDLAMMSMQRLAMSFMVIRLPLANSTYSVKRVAARRNMF